MITDGIGVYVHIPFCVKKCNYCDFCSYSGRDEDMAGYIDALIREIEEYKQSPRIYANTLYIGGGTPSLLPISELKRLFDSLLSTFDFDETTEITIEANPGTVTREKAEAYKALGINRVSLGLQSIHENEMKILGRIHNFADFITAYTALREAGIDNINVDLMYSIPEQTVESFGETLDKIIALTPEHISAYSLIIEEGTPIHRMRESLSLPTEDEELLMYEMLCSKLLSNGYNHYEISNYARQGFESRHNLKYWECVDYIGFGAAAHSCFGGVRYANPADIDAYIRRDGYSEYSPISCADAAFEYAMMHLRLKKGFSLSEYRDKFGRSFTEGKESVLDKLSKKGLINLTADGISITEQGFYVSNYILTEIL